MRILVLPDDLFGYLQHVVRSYAAGGIDPDEGLALYHLNQAIKGAQTVDDAQVAKAKSEDGDETQTAELTLTQVLKNESEAR